MNRNFMSGQERTGAKRKAQTSTISKRIKEVAQCGRTEETEQQAQAIIEIVGRERDIKSREVVMHFLILNHLTIKAMLIAQDFQSFVQWYSAHPQTLNPYLFALWKNRN